MLFNSYVFILAFLPVTLLVFYAIGSSNRHRTAIAWLVAASLFFYGWWNPAYVSLIIASILINYALGARIGSERPNANLNRSYLILGIVFNLGLLGYFKYANFFVDNLHVLTGVTIDLPSIVLPLAISFFTFQQIAYLVDAYQGKTREYNFLHYCLFVTFFPQLIAGPIVHHKEMLPQFSTDRTYRIDLSMLAAGITVFFVGLFKKTILADGVAAFSTPVFDAAASGTALTLFEAWGGALAYTYQLYFDFSGYSDMAVGLGLMFGIRLPLNFYSPYKATNIVDFWRRWHITLSRFLRDYLYIPMGGNRKGPFRRYVNLLLTMFLGGLWHGAGWTFVLWGGLHGFYLVVNHAWQGLRKRAAFGSNGYAGSWSRVAGGTITFVAVVIAWVLFRADGLDSALEMYRAMFGLNGLSLPESLIGRLGDWQGVLVDMGVQFNGMFGNRIFDPVGIVWLLILAIIVWGFPNLHDWIGSCGALREQSGSNVVKVKHRWAARAGWGVALGLLSGLAILGLSDVSEFLYFQF